MGIYIKRSHRGQFKAKAQKHNLTVKQYENKVLAKGSKASAATKKQAVFAKNAAKWKK
jgi:hypothetical protein